MCITGDSNSHCQIFWPIRKAHACSMAASYYDMVPDPLTRYFISSGCVPAAHGICFTLGTWQGWGWRGAFSRINQQLLQLQAEHACACNGNNSGMSVRVLVVIVLVDACMPWSSEQAAWS